MVARLGIATGKGHAAMICERFGKWTYGDDGNILRLSGFMPEYVIEREVPSAVITPTANGLRLLWQFGCGSNSVAFI